jgi:3'-phosphoadenosine 5'-phosphosulfate sulfotransferase (PAPS reductase)/FAD synthetase
VLALHDAPHSVALFLAQKDQADFAMHNWVPFEFPNVTPYTIAYTQRYQYPLVVVRTLKPVEQFLVENGVPYPPAQRRWCTKQFKIVPSQLFYRRYHLGGITQLLGITRFQSSRRSQMWASVGPSKYLYQKTLPIYQELPIFDLSIADQLRAMAAAGIAPSPYYTRYGENGHGCAWCFFKSTPGAKSIEAFRGSEFYATLKAQDPLIYALCEAWRHAASGYIPKKYPPEWEQHEYYWNRETHIM